MASKFPSFSQWKQIFTVLKKQEKATLLIFFLLAASSFVFLVLSFYINNTKIAPALGGDHIEGVVGQPRFINPLYGETNDVDRTLIELVFSGLMTYDKSGQLVADLADSYKISEDGKIYDFKLKDKIFWHDGKPLTVDDIIFTIKTIQNSDYKSPLRANWIDVDIEKTSEKSVRFKLKSPYNAFLENCTVKIIPHHIWSSIPPENFLLSPYNLQPIGSGPFQFLELSQTDTGFIKTLYFQSNRRYYNKPAFINNISFEFFEKRDDLIEAALSKEIDGFSLAALNNGEAEAEGEAIQSWLKNDTFYAYSFYLPRYFAVFFNNQKSSLFSDSNLRKAFTLSVNKEELIQKISDSTKNNINRVDSPVLSDFFNYQNASVIYDFDTDKAKELLDKSGFKDNGQGAREKPVEKKPAFQFKSYLKLGSKNSEVTELQACLGRLPNDNFGGLLKDETIGTYGKATEDAVTEFQKKYLPELNPTGETGVATRKKLNELCILPQQNSLPLKFTLVTVNQPQLLETANLLKNYWQSMGAIVDVNAVSITDLKPIIKNRSYDALLYGEALGVGADLYPFWHSSQKVDPGLNLSSYESKDADQLLKKSRETLDGPTKQESLEKLQDTILNDAPALFLYNPDYVYWVSGKIQGINSNLPDGQQAKIVDPAKRFVNITEWFIKTKRVWK